MTIGELNLPVKTSNFYEVYTWKRVVDLSKVFGRDRVRQTNLYEFHI